MLTHESITRVWFVPP